ncbi:hypothetical protein M422DRAFT_228985 [Sphaerobolus stellatus SS14]|uniref:Nephrocystin 3-like N-terminal domain-containing protein n=1 Tax=Sphaerobolus stellatus (strain SS14) TaxID=990650 RepID=A0A0C9VNX9_SPHS4|nr:hypothetical protein M422DRAFT_228985 [Sphaerobolus stellatus SS14]
MPQSFRELKDKVRSKISQKDLSVAKTGWNGLKLALNILKEASPAFPPLQSAVGGLLKTLETIDQASDNQAQVDSIATRINQVSEVIMKYDDANVPQRMSDTVDGLAKNIDRRTKDIQERMQRGRILRILDGSKDATAIVAILNDLSFALTLLQIEITMGIKQQGDQMQQAVKYMYDDAILQKLEPVQSALYERVRSRVRGCMEGTRIDTLASLMAWASNPNSASVYLVNGMAGIGKSAISSSFCKALAASPDCELGGSFFCSRQENIRRDVERILPTIAFQLARRFPLYGQATVDILKETLHAPFSSKTLQEQAKTLFMDILLTTHGISKEVPVVVVIDALDECVPSTDTNFTIVSDFLRVLLRSNLPFKVLLTSRPEPHILQGFSLEEHFLIDEELTLDQSFRSNIVDYATLKVHDIKLAIVEEDIKRYLRRELNTVIQGADEGISALAKKCGKLFIFASTAVKYIKSRHNLTPTDRHLRLLALLNVSISEPSSERTKDIDKLYQLIFMEAYDGKELSEINRLRMALDTVVCLRQPQSVAVITALLGKKLDDVRTLLGNFNSVLDIPDDDNSLVLIFHASFPDYLLDKSRSHKYHLDPTEPHVELASKCLEKMNDLSWNICKMETRKMLNSEVSEDVIRKSIPDDLKYACTFWASHLDASKLASNGGASITKKLENFVEDHLLNWLECLSLMKELHIAVACLRKAILYLSVRYTAFHNDD